MSRIEKVDLSNPSQELSALIAGMEKNMGKIPNIFLHMAHAPSVLSSFLAFSGSASSTSLSPAIQEKIALCTAEMHQCDYCLAAHNTLGKRAGLTDEEIEESRKGDSQKKKEKAMLNFVQKIVQKRGHISESDFQLIRSHGVTEKELVEIIFFVMVNTFTNYFNNIIQPDIDFKKAPELNS
ncbi:MAG: carboxymuconolactone decarboxylase family protein [Chlamydia sp.]